MDNKRTIEVVCTCRAPLESLLLCYIYRIIRMRGYDTAPMQIDNAIIAQHAQPFCYYLPESVHAIPPDCCRLAQPRLPPFCHRVLSVCIYASFVFPLPQSRRWYRYIGTTMIVLCARTARNKYN